MCNYLLYIVPYQDIQAEKGNMWTEQLSHCIFNKPTCRMIFAKFLFLWNTNFWMSWSLKTLECHQSIPFQISAIYFAIEQKSDFQLKNEAPKFSLNSIYYSSFKLPFTALSNYSCIYHVSWVMMPYVTWLRHI